MLEAILNDWIKYFQMIKYIDIYINGLEHLLMKKKIPDIFSVQYKRIEFDYQ